MSYIEMGSRDYRKALVGIALGSMVTFATLYSPQTLLSVFSEQYHVSPAVASFTISFTTGALAIVMFLVSLFSDAWARKTIMSLSLVLTSILAIISAFCHNFNCLLVIRLLEGFSLAGFPAIALTYLSEEFSPASIGGIMGVYVAGNGIGAFVGRVVIGAITDLLSWQGGLLILGAIDLICSLWFWLTLPQSRNFKRSSVSTTQIWANVKASFLDRNLTVLYGMGFILMGVYVTLFNYIGYSLMQAPYRLSQTILGFIFVVNLIGSAGALFLGRLADRYPRRWVVSGAFCLSLAGALLTLHSDLGIKVGGMIIFALGFSMGHSTICGWVGTVAPCECKAQAASAYLLFYYTGSSLLGWLGGFFWDFGSWPGVIALICGLLGIAAGLVWLTASPSKQSDRGQ